MPTFENTWPDSTDKFWVIKNGSNIRVKSEENTGITRSVILDPSDYPELTHPLRIFQRGIDLEFVPQACVDYDGNVYDAIKISGEDGSGSDVRQFNQLWTIQNLKVTHNRLGKLISVSTTQSSTPAIYRSNIGWPEEYGLIYNWWAAYGKNDDPGVVPEGWELPSLTDYRKLNSFLQSNLAFSSDGENSGYIAKAACSKTGWTTTPIQFTPGCSPELNNSSMLGVTPSGYWSSGSSTSVGTRSRYWLSTLDGDNSQYWGYSNTESYRLGLVYGSMAKNNGAAIRCVKNLQ